MTVGQKDGKARPRLLFQPLAAPDAELIDRVGVACGRCYRQRFEGVSTDLIELWRDSVLEEIEHRKDGGLGGGEGADEGSRLGACDFVSERGSDFCYCELLANVGDLAIHEQW